MTDFNNVAFQSTFLDPSISVIEGLRFSNCFFDNCSLIKADHPSGRMVVRNAQFYKCKQRSSSINNAVIEDTLVDGMGKEGRIPFFSWGAVFKHVTLKGKLSAMKLNQFIDPNPKPSIQQPWDSSNRHYYRTVDWALDLKDAEFQGSVDLHCVPGSLVRRDPETQILVKRSTLNSTDWRNLPWGNSSLGVAIDWFLRDGLYDDVVLVACKRAVGFKSDMQAIAMLRQLQIAVYD